MNSRVLSASFLGLVLAGSAFAGSLVHRYSFNDGNANDSVGQTNGKVLGAPTFANGQVHFDGAKGERIELPASGPSGINVNALKAVTLEAWYTIDRTAPFQRIFDFGAATKLDEQGKGTNYLFFTPTSWFKDARAVISNDTIDPTLKVTGSKPFKAEMIAKGPASVAKKEMHVAVVVDATTLTLFLDGVQVSQAPLGTRTLDKVSNQFALLGASLYGYGPNDPVLTGAINEFRIYDAALTAAQIADSFKAGPDKVAIEQ